MFFCRLSCKSLEQLSVLLCLSSTERVRSEIRCPLANSKEGKCKKTCPGCWRQQGLLFNHANESSRGLACMTGSLLGGVGLRSGFACWITLGLWPAFRSGSREQKWGSGPGRSSRSLSRLGVLGVPPEGFRERWCAATVWSPPSGGALVALGGRVGWGLRTLCLVLRRSCAEPHPCLPGCRNTVSAEE